MHVYVPFECSWHTGVEQLVQIKRVLRRILTLCKQGLQSLFPVNVFASFFCVLIILSGILSSLPKNRSIAKRFKKILRTLVIIHAIFDVRKNQ